jgi:hypothetical protein
MNEVSYVALPECKTDLKIGPSLITRDQYNSERTVLSTSLPIYLEGTTPPRPDPSHPPSLVSGIIKRFGYKPPTINRKLLRQFRRFVIMWLRHASGWKPLTEVDLPSLDEWLDSTDYSASRKEELRRVWNDRKNRKLSRSDLKKVKSFIKDETYPEYKCPRLINSRVDLAKCFFGPIVKAVSDKVFSHPAFIKKTPVVDRPEAIYNRLHIDGAEYDCTDYTAYEAHFVQELMDACEFELYKYLCGSLGIWPELRWFLKEVLQGINTCIFKFVTIWILATRMSGEMNTSQDNGFTNMMIYLFLVWINAKKIGLASDVSPTSRMYHAEGMFEGDDGLTCTIPRSLAPTAEQYRDLGLTIKIITVRNLNEASFCGQIYDVEDKVVVTDIVDAVARVGWTNKRYVQASQSTLLQLLRARGYSFCYQYNGCPVLATLGRRILELTQDVVVEQRIIDGMDWWEKQKYLEAVAGLPVFKYPTAGTRALVHKIYGITLTQQFEWEKIISKMQFGPLVLPGLTSPQCWTDYYERYNHNCYDRNPLWLVKPEDELLKRILKAAPQSAEFVRSLGGAILAADA